MQFCLCTSFNLTCLQLLPLVRFTVTAIVVLERYHWVSMVRRNLIACYVFSLLELLLNRSHYNLRTITSRRLYEDDTYEDLIYTACTDGGSINTAHLYALSAAIMLPLKPFYPPLNESDEHSRRYTRLIIGRTVSRSCNESDVITLIWSQKWLPKSMKSFRSHHFVLLC